MAARQTWMLISALAAMMVGFGLAEARADGEVMSGESLGSSVEEAFGPCVWTREFAPPRNELSITLIPIGESFAVWTPSLGFLREAVDHPLYLSTNCTVTTRIDSDSRGYSITYVISNQTGDTQNLPTLQVAGNLLNPVLENLDHRVGCEWETIDATNGEQYSSRKAAYPESLYAPVILLRDTRFSVGFALEYDVLGYKHEIRTNLYRGPAGSRYADQWTTRFFMDGTIDPGESRVYQLDVHYNEPADWIHTLRTYRKFLIVNYGEVRYRQNMRPVWMQQLGDTLRLNHDNRRGFNGLRADLNGFANDVNEDLGYLLEAGYDRMLVRTPGGVYYQNRQNNFPPQIMTAWTPAMERSILEWRRMGQAGIDLFFWWGRSGQIADHWDDDELENFDPDDPVQASRMLLEWTSAVTAGAAGLGLDKFTVLRPWQALPWLERLRAFKPDAQFIAEPAAYDILHTHLPTFLYSIDVRNQPHLLADYLVPGREMWVLLEGEDNTVERARQLIVEQGLTIVTNTQTFSADDLRQAIRIAQGCDRAN